MRSICALNLGPSAILDNFDSAKSGAVATAETFKAASLSGYLFESFRVGAECSDDFYVGQSRKLNTCLENYLSEWIIITATANIITTTNYTDSSCTKKIAVKAVSYTSGCVPGEQLKRLAKVTVIAPTAAHPFPLSHVQIR